MNTLPINLSVDLTDRVALVTGASSGLGYRFAQTLANAGAKVVLTGRRLDRLQSLAKEIADAGGIAKAMQLDVRDPSAITAVVEQTEKTFGVIDILLNNAGIPGVSQNKELSVDEIDSLLNTNVRAPYLLSMAVGKRLIKAKKKGNIVNIASIGAYYYSANTHAVLYCASKSAVIRMTETMSVEWAKYNININAIAPGLFQSEMSEGFMERVGDRVLNTFPRGRIGEPHHLDSTLLFLVSPASEFVTGTCIKVNDAQHPI